MIGLADGRTFDVCKKIHSLFEVMSAIVNCTHSPRFGAMCERVPTGEWLQIHVGNSVQIVRRETSSKEKIALGPVHRISEQTLDDVLKVLIQDLLKHGNPISPTKGPAKELIGVSIEIQNPRARVSRSASRSKIFSALGEFLWYMSGSDETTMIRHYIPMYGEISVDGRAEGAYGPRLFGESAQLENVIGILRTKPDSRQAVVQILTENDLTNKNDVPCTISLQFLARSGKLHLIANMRSNDVYLGLPHDIFAFTMIQEMVAQKLGIGLGSYHHFVGSMHLYQKDEDAAQQFIDEGWQSRDSEMPQMPAEGLDKAIKSLLEAESQIRNRELPMTNANEISSLPYWADLQRLLLARACEDPIKLQEIRNSMHHDYFKIFVSDRGQLKG